MSLEQLRAVVAIAEEGGLVRAARRLHISQPPLTRKLRALEDELGVALFERAARGMAPTPAGTQLLEDARVILKAVDRIAGRSWLRPASSSTSPQERHLQEPMPGTLRSSRPDTGVGGEAHQGPPERPDVTE
jgi:DNA-binding transcriptional LysR family regulator